MQSVATHFNLPDASQLQWRHAVNSSARVREMLSDSAAHMAEGDVQFASDDALPCLAHPWQDIADMDVEDWAGQLAEAGKGLKLDFGSAEAVEPTLAVLQRLKLEVPVVLHANVFTLLNGDGTEDTLEPEQFIRLCQNYLPTAVISLGWSLKREADADGRMEDVLIHQMADMLLKRLGDAPYNLEICGGYTSGWERGAALILDPIPAVPPAVTEGAANVVQAAHLFRRVA